MEFRLRSLKILMDVRSCDTKEYIKNNKNLLKTTKYKVRKIVKIQNQNHVFPLYFDSFSGFLQR